MMTMTERSDQVNMSRRFGENKKNKFTDDKIERGKNGERKKHEKEKNGVINEKDVSRMNNTNAEEKKHTEEMNESHCVGNIF